VQGELAVILGEKHNQNFDVLSMIVAEQGENFTGQALLSLVAFWEMTLDRN
jgi:hypothetical protein